ncbi:hypothetical protein A374_07959 [Fictibacillus macauensis ZFHKF-1]|uniref:Uncharacterized protein n=1 Tax=Fictibacillus macauensis ZFHKF-1 TaxID=1196324 RepID=I8UFZ6_9BACL|nr:hypothetical protein [Fictibacillus macauensis]EIT85753.1 hypothetical protein A374_07959 [Fictibacillus macauensis ZFHKF-1]
MKYKLSVLDVQPVNDHPVASTKIVYIETTIYKSDGQEFYRGITSVLFNQHGILPQVQSMKNIFTNKQDFMAFYRYVRRYIKQQVRYL